MFALPRSCCVLDTLQKWCINIRHYPVSQIILSYLGRLFFLTSTLYLALCCYLYRVLKIWLALNHYSMAKTGSYTFWTSKMWTKTERSSILLRHPPVLVLFEPYGNLPINNMSKRGIYYKLLSNFMDLIHFLNWRGMWWKVAFTHI